MSKNFLSEKQKDDIAELIDKHINLPLISSKKERVIFRKIVDSLDKYMKKNIADELLDSINDRDTRIETIVSSALKDNLAPTLSKLVPLPFLPGAIKRAAINFLIDLIVNVMASATTLDDKINQILGKRRATG